MNRGRRPAGNRDLFDKKRQVQRLANYGLQDGKIFELISRTTPTSGQESAT